MVIYQLSNDFDIDFPPKIQYAFRVRSNQHPKGSDIMPMPNERIYTIEDIYNLPDGQRAELIDGVIYDMAPPSRMHQKLVSELHTAIVNHIRSKGGSCDVYPAPFAVFLNADNETYVEPDISVVCDKNKLTDRGCEGAPDFVIEIVSPSTRRKDYNTKNAQYANAGVREYWIVDPAKERTTIYHYEEDAAPMIVPFNQPVQCGIYKDLLITIDDLLI